MSDRGRVSGGTAGGVLAGAVPLRNQTGKELNTADLFGAEKTVSIRHGGEIYTLRITRSGKLILTK